MQQGDLVVCNDIMGFVVEIKALTVVLNTEVGMREISRNNNIAVMSTAAELAQFYANQVIKVVFKH